MSVRFYHRGHREARRFSLCPLCLCVLCGKSSFVLIVASLLTLSTVARNQNRHSLQPEKRIRYQIHLALDFENRAYTGTERVRWINRGDHPTSTLFFHLYPNVRFQGYTPPTEKTPSGQLVS